MRGANQVAIGSAVDRSGADATPRVDFNRGSPLLQKAVLVIIQHCIRHQVHWAFTYSNLQTGKVVTHGSLGVPVALAMLGAGLDEVRRVSCPQSAITQRGNA